MKQDDFDMTSASERDSWPEDPYKGLANYEIEDEVLFAGRSREIGECAQLLANSQTKLLILHGQTGCGKSSFLRAGLIPALERNGAGYIFLRRRSFDDPEKWTPSFVRCGADPLTRIAEEIFAFSAQPISVRTATGQKQIDLSATRLGTDRLEAFVSACADPSTLVRSLELLSAAVPHTLVVILDQAEEVITLNSSNTDNRSRFSRFIKELASSDIDMRFVLAIRKDHSGQFIGSIQVDNEISPAFRTFFLSDLSRDGIGEAILRPTLKSLPEDPEKPAPYERYGFEFAPGVVKLILDDLDKIPAGATLPVMQIVCRELYRQVRELPAPKLIELRLYEQGGITGRVKRHLQDSLGSALGPVKALRGDDRERVALKWLRVLRRFVQEEGDGRVHTDVVPRKTLGDWIKSEGIVGDFDAVIDKLTDPKVLVLRTFSVFAPGSTSERELFSLGHDMIGIALGEALREAESTRLVSDAVKKRVLFTVMCSTLISLCLLAAAVYVLRANSIRRQNIDGLLAKASSNRADNVLASIVAARAAEKFSEETVFPFTKDSRPKQALWSLFAGLPSIALAGQSAEPLDRNSSIFPTFALPGRAGFAMLRAGGVLEIDTVKDGAIQQQVFSMPEPFKADGPESKLQSLEFSDASANLLLAMYRQTDAQQPGGVVALATSRQPVLFSYDDLIAASGNKDTSAAKLLLYGVSGASVVLYSLSDGNKPDLHLKSLVVTESTDLKRGIDRRMVAPTRFFSVKGQRIVFFFYQAAKFSGSGAPPISVAKFESNDLFSETAPRAWVTKDFPSVKQCERDGRSCDLTAVQHLQQTDLVVLGLSEVVQGRFDQQRKSVLSNLVIVDLSSGATTEVDLRAATSARQKCDRASFGRPTITRPDGVRAELRDEDVPSFLVKGPKGPILGYASRTSAQLVDVSTANMTCRDIYFPDVDMVGWTANGDTGKLFAASRKAGFMWDLVPKEPTGDADLQAGLAKVCSSQLSKFVGRDDEPQELTNERKRLLAQICP